MIPFRRPALPCRSILLSGFTALTMLTTPLAQAGTVSLTGDGVVRFAPDAAHITLSVQTRADTAQAARDAASGRVTAWETAAGSLLSQLEDYDDSQLTLSEIPEYDDQGRPTEERYFQASQTIRFNLLDLDHINDVVQAAESAGLSYHLNENSYYRQDNAALEDAALAEAIADAQRQCEFIAQRLEAECGDVESLTVIDQGHYPRPVMMMARDAVQKESISQIGEREISARVDVTFELD